MLLFWAFLLDDGDGSHVFLGFTLHVLRTDDIDIGTERNQFPVVVSVPCLLVVGGPENESAGALENHEFVFFGVETVAEGLEALVDSVTVGGEGIGYIEVEGGGDADGLACLVITAGFGADREVDGIKSAVDILV